MRSSIHLVVLDQGSPCVEDLLARLAEEAGVEVVGRGDLETLFDLSSDEPPDVVLVDADLIHPPDHARRNALSYVRGMFPGSKLVVLTDRSDVEAVLGAAASGASGILSKQTSPEDLLAAIQNASAGAVVIERELISGMMAGSRAFARTSSVPSEPSPLTPRETEVLTLLSRGLHVRPIARELRLSVHTVRGHVKKILSKLDCHSQLEAVVRAAGRGWLPGDLGSD